MFWMTGFYMNGLFCPSGFNMDLSVTPSFCRTSYYLVLIGAPPSQRSPSDKCSGYDCQIVVPLIHLSVKKCAHSVLFFLHSSCSIKQIQPQTAWKFLFYYFRDRFCQTKLLLVFFVKVCSFVYGNAYKHASCFIMKMKIIYFHGLNLYTNVSIMCWCRNSPTAVFV